MQVPLRLLCDDLLLTEEVTGNMYKFHLCILYKKYYSI